MASASVLLPVERILVIFWDSKTNSLDVLFREGDLFKNKREMFPSAATVFNPFECISQPCVSWVSSKDPKARRLVRKNPLECRSTEEISIILEKIVLKFQRHEKVRSSSMFSPQRILQQTAESSYTGFQMCRALI
jgi:hypothetical protein